MATGRMTVDHPVVEDVLAAGDVTVDHVQVLARVAVVKHREELFAEHVDTLIDNAVDLRVDDFAVVASRWGSLVDDEATSRSFMEQHQRRGLYLSPTFDGVVMVDGMLDPVAGATVITALDRLSAPDPADTPEGREPRRNAAPTASSSWAKRICLVRTGRQRRRRSTWSSTSPR